MTKLSERMLRDLHVGIGDIVLSDIINEASALEAHIEALEGERDADWRKFVHLRDDNERIRVLGEELAQKEAYIEVLKKVANEQAENAGLWFRARTAPEEYLQNALRRLHALIEGDALMAALRSEEEK